MKIEYTVTEKKNFTPFNTKKGIFYFSKKTIDDVFSFAYGMSFGQDGQHRTKRSGGQKERKNGEIFSNVFQGKIAEMAIYTSIYVKNKKMYEQLSKPDFETYGLGSWDGADIKYNNLKFSIKSTKFFGNVLLLETKDWNANGEYKPNIIRNNNSHIYDYIILVRIKEVIDEILKKMKIYYEDTCNKVDLYNHISLVDWCFDIPGYITKNDLINIIKEKQIIFQNSYLNKKTKMEAENYYVETGKLRDFSKLVKEL